MEDKKKKIFDAVCILLSEIQNPRDITVAQIARNAGIGKGTVYEYFKSKNDIIIGAFLYYTESLLNKIEESCSEGDFKTRFGKCIEIIDKSATKNKSMFNNAIRFITEKQLKSSENSFDCIISDNMEQLLNKLSGVLMLICEAGIKENKIRSDIDIIELLFAFSAVMSFFNSFGRRVIFENFSDKKLEDFCFEKFIKILS